MDKLTLPLPEGEEPKVTEAEATKRWNIYGKIHKPEETYREETVGFVGRIWHVYNLTIEAYNQLASNDAPSRRALNEVLIYTDKLANDISKFDDRLSDLERKKMDILWDKMGLVDKGWKYWWENAEIKKDTKKYKQLKAAIDLLKENGYTDDLELRQIELAIKVLKI